MINYVFLFLVLNELQLSTIVRIFIAVFLVNIYAVMEERKSPSPADVADAFVKQYFVILDKSPQNLHKFYLEPSLLGWPGIDGVVTPVTTLKVSHFITCFAADCNLETVY